MVRIHALVGEPQAGRDNYHGKVRKGALVRAARQASQACQDGLETRSHACEAVPCHCCVYEPTLSGRFRNNGEYALSQAGASRSGANHVFEDKLR